MFYVYMDYIWTVLLILYGCSMCSIDFYGLYIECIWILYGCSVECIWTYNECSLDLIWFKLLCYGSQWSCYCVSMCAIWMVCTCERTCTALHTLQCCVFEARHHCSALLPVPVAKGVQRAARCLHPNWHAQPMVVGC